MPAILSMGMFGYCLELLALFVGIASVGGLLSDPALRNVRLTADHVERVIRATQAMQAAATTDPEFVREYLSEEPAGATLEETIRGLEAKRPRHVALIRASGLTTREYFVTFLALLQSDAVQRHEKEAASFTRSVNPDNVAFARRHPTLARTAVREIERLNEIKEQRGRTH